MKRGDELPHAKHSRFQQSQSCDWVRGGWREEEGALMPFYFTVPKSISCGNKIKFPQARSSSLRKGEWASSWWGGTTLAKALPHSFPPCCWIFLSRKRDCHFVRGSSRPVRWFKMGLTHSMYLGSCFPHVNLQHENLQSPWAMVLLPWNFMGYLFRKAGFNYHNTAPSLSLFSDLHKVQTWHPMLHG